MKVEDNLIRTNDNCVGCNKCIGVCSCIGAMTASIDETGKNVIHVDGSKCIACGACFDACEHHAREFSDDTESFFEALKRGEKISLLIAPAFPANYPSEYESVLGGLKQMGANHMISVSFGADITTWGYLNYIRQNNFLGGISQPCPAVVSYIERYLPELLPKLMPVQSPMMCAAIYVNKVMGIKDKLAFISPCIAKKTEITSKRGKGLVSYNVTFNHLMAYVREHGISGPSCRDEIEYGLGSVYPMPGGLKENICWFLGEDAFIRQREGEGRLYHYLEANRERLLRGDTLYQLVDILNCEQGCLYGTGTEPARNATDDVLIEMLRIKQASRNDRPCDAWSRKLTPEQRFEELNKQFAHLDLNDYLCEYTDQSAGCTYSKPTQAQLEDIFNEMGKTTPSSRQINCSCCGYETCEQMAVAIHNGYNHKENCIHYQRMELFAHKGIQEAMQAESPIESIQIILEYLGKALRGDRTYVFERNEKGGDENTFEWVAEGITAEIEHLQDLPSEVCAHWYRNFSVGKYIAVKNTEEIHSENPLLYEILKQQGIRSLVVVPLFDDGNVIGFYGVDNPSGALFDSASDILQIMGYFITVYIRRRDMIQKLQEMGLRDQLTQLGNRHAMQEYINEWNTGESIGIVYCDITGLKQVNDTQGHSRGDKLIMDAGECLRHAFNGYGLFRIGGDELLALCTGIEPDTLEEKVKELKRYAKEQEVILAVGSVWEKSGAGNIEQLISTAEALMYEDKSVYYKSMGIERRRDFTTTG